MQALSDVFGDISSDIWPARSPDLHPCDIFFRDCLKDRIYNSSPWTEEALKENTHREITNIPAEELQIVNQNLLRRCEECILVEGQHFLNTSCGLWTKVRTCLHSERYRPSGMQICKQNLYAPRSKRCTGLCEAQSRGVGLLNRNPLCTHWSRKWGACRHTSTYETTTSKNMVVSSTSVCRSQLLNS
jgi:hypothetical protein